MYFKAINSSKDLRPADKIAMEIINKIEKKEKLRFLKESVETVLENMKPCDAYLLGVQYGVGELGVGCNEKKDRNFYRKTALAVKRFSDGMSGLGFNKIVYENYLKSFSFLNAEYQKSVALKEKISDNQEYRLKDTSESLRKK